MLKHLHIQNLVIIDELDLQFQQGMTVFTGETGAGKSILIDALGLILGDRADTSVIRDNSDRAEITATFDIGKLPQIIPLLDQQAIASADDELIIRRIISRDGRSRAFVNSSQVPIQVLRLLGEHLVDIHGQHAHQSLMKKSVQRTLLDHHARHADKLEAVRSAYTSWHSSTTRLEQLSQGLKDHEATVSLLQYQVQELEELAPADGEFDSLEDEYKRLDNATRLLEVSHTCLEQLHASEQSIDTRLHQLGRDLREMLKYDASLNRIVDLVDSALIQIREAADELRLYPDSVDIDPEQFSTLEKRLDSFHNAARKHHVLPQELPDHLQSLRTRLDELTGSRDAIENLQQEQAKALEQYRQSATDLHKSRKKAALVMAKAITAQLRQLGMPEGEFSVAISQSASEIPQPEGSDQVEYLISLNPGQAMQPLRKVASGGELSRISLAVQIIIRDAEGIPTLIFDEVDAGIGGGIAEIVGNLLKDLATQHQIFCVTHLPQVASQGDHHVQVRKQADKNSTFTNVIPLQPEQRVEEIARMLGGIKISDKTLAHAREMLGQVNSGN